MTNTKTLIAAAVMALIAMPNAIAAETAANQNLPAAEARNATASPKAMALLRKVSPDAIVVRRFNGPSGLIGFVLGDSSHPKAEPVIVWMTPDQGNLLVGNVYDANGRNLTDVAAEYYHAANPNREMVKESVNAAIHAVVQRAEQLKQQQMATAGNPEGQAGDNPPPPQPPQSIITGDDAKPGVAVVARLRAEGATITEQRPGNAKAPIITIFYDPGCEHCRELHKYLNPTNLKPAGIDWIPVSLFNEKDRAVMAASKGTMAAIDASFGVMPVDKSDTTIEGLHKVENATAMLKKYIIAATPVVTVQYPNAPEKNAILLGPSLEQLKQAAEGKIPGDDVITTKGK